MTDDNRTATAVLTGRLRDAPSMLLHEEVLAGQFDYELPRLLPWYVLVEKVLLAEYQRMEVLSAGDCGTIGALLHGITPADLVPDPAANLSDLALAIERHVEARLATPVPSWHVDRSRNDLQACAQLLFDRECLAAVVETLCSSTAIALDAADRYADLPMPGYTQLQSAQVISPGFYLAAVGEQLGAAARDLLSVYDRINISPLGAGAMAGQELAWDRARMAWLVGCSGPVPHALVAVASRSWRLQIAAELARLAVVMSRLVTDLMTWAGGEFGFIDLPDDFAGISAAMPQKKNFPILERIRGRTAHIATAYVDLLMTQRNVPFTNMIEVSKEVGSGVHEIFDTVGSALRLFGAVLANLRFRPDRLRRACARDFLGAFTLANLLTLREGVPWRTAQVMVGEYISAAVDAGHDGSSRLPNMLLQVSARHGFHIRAAESLLAEAFDAERGLRTKRTPGSAHPDAVRVLVAEQRAGLADTSQQLTCRRETVRRAIKETNDLVGLTG